MEDFKKPPATLKGDARKLWQHYAAELSERKILCGADLAALERLCRLEVQAQVLTTKIENEGIVIEDRDGTQRRHPGLIALTNVSGIIEALKKSLAIGAFFRYRIEGKEPVSERQPSALMALRRKTP